MSSPLRKALYWVGILVGGSLFLNQVWRGYESFTTKSIAIIYPVGLWVSVGFIILATGTQIAAWRMMMANLGVIIAWREVLKGFVLSFLPRYIPGSVWGYVSRAEWMKQSYGTPYSISNSGSILEVVLIFMGVCLVSGIYLVENLTGNIRWFLLSLFCLLPLITWGGIRWVLSSSAVQLFLRKHSISNQVKFFPLLVWVVLCGMHAIAWVFYGASVFWIIQSIFPNHSVALANTTFLFSVSWLLGFIVPFVPAGLGIREQSLSTLLISMTLLSAGQASSVAVLSRLLTLLGELVWLAIGVLLKRFPAR